LDESKQKQFETISIDLLNNTAFFASNLGVMAAVTWYDDRIELSAPQKEKAVLFMDLAKTWSGFIGYDTGTMRLKRTCGYFLNIFPVYQVFEAQPFPQGKKRFKADPSRRLEE